MIIYGTKAKEIAKEILTDKCQNCGKQNSIDMHVFQKYAHVFWIPFFPIGKTGISQCDHCKQVLKLKEMPASLKISYDNLKAQSKSPFWMFSGLALVAVLITIGIVSDKQKDQKNAKLILAPQAGDIFEIKLPTNQYTLYKVAEVSNDSVYLQINNYETNKISGLADMKKKGDAVYTEFTLPFSKKTLTDMLSSGEIIDIDRK
jgi:zinc-ribbon family